MSEQPVGPEEKHTVRKLTYGSDVLEMYDRGETLPDKGILVYCEVGRGEGAVFHIIQYGSVEYFAMTDSRSRFGEVSWQAGLGLLNEQMGTLLTFGLLYEYSEYPHKGTPPSSREKRYTGLTLGEDQLDKTPLPGGGFIYVQKQPYPYSGLHTSLCWRDNSSTFGRVMLLKYGGYGGVADVVGEIMEELIGVDKSDAETVAESVRQRFKQVKN